MGLMDVLGAGSSNSGGGFYDPSFFDQRQNQINDFSNSLTAARTRYLNNYQNFQNQDFLTRLMPNMNASYAARGLQMNGGAYSAELARQAAGIQGHALDTGFNAQNQDLMAVDNANAGLFGQRANAYTASAQTVANNTAARRGAMMSALGGLGGAAVGALAGPSLSMGGNAIAGALGNAMRPSSPVAAGNTPSSNYVMQQRPNSWQNYGNMPAY